MLRGWWFTARGLGPPMMNVMVPSQVFAKSTVVLWGATTNVFAFSEKKSGFVRLRRVATAKNTVVCCGFKAGHDICPRLQSRHFVRTGACENVSVNPSNRGAAIFYNLKALFLRPPFLPEL